MNLQDRVPILIVSGRPDDAELVSRNLRNAGCNAHCTLVAGPGEVPQALGAEVSIELIADFTTGTDLSGLAGLVQIRDRAAPDLPILVVMPKASEELVTAACEAGAQDLVSSGAPMRLQQVALREIRHGRLRRRLASMRDSTDELQAKLDTLVRTTDRALIIVQEGIVVDLNPAGRQLLGIAEEADLTGMPILDLFDEEAHTAIKGAMVAALGGSWSGDSLSVRTATVNGKSLSVTASLEQSSYDDEPCLNFSLMRDARRDDEAPRSIVEKSERHPLTGFFRRQKFLTEMEKQLDEPSRGGLRVLAYVKPDEISELRDHLGPIVSDDLLLEFAKILQDQTKENDLYGQFGGDLFMVLMSRGTERDAIAWADNMRERVAAHVFRLADQSRSITCTIGLAAYAAEGEDLATLIIRAQRAFQEGARIGGNSTVMPSARRTGGVDKAADAEYVKKIKQALMKDNFRLAYQPVANLAGDTGQMFDVLIRMLDNNREIMPNAFLPAASRYGLMKNIDRWVIVNAMQFAAEQSPHGLFIRLSAESVVDTTLVGWIAQQIEITKVKPHQLVFQITEQLSQAQLLEVKACVSAIKGIGCKIALEHFGVGAQPLQVLDHLALDYLKIDGSLLEGVTTDKDKQAKIKRFITAAKEHRVATVAERVEDANTMAVLWQLDIQFIQGFYVQGPEEVVLETH